jgi:hypothetical protein
VLCWLVSLLCVSWTNAACTDKERAQWASHRQSGCAVRICQLIVHAREMMLVVQGLDWQSIQHGARLGVLRVLHGRAPCKMEPGLLAAHTDPRRYATCSMYL